MLSGRPDYSVWYGGSESLCLNILIVEAKGGPKSNDAVAQLLGYMGEYLSTHIEIFEGS
jgi:hypothetical protein